MRALPDYDALFGINTTDFQLGDGLGDGLEVVR